MRRFASGFRFPLAAALALASAGQPPPETVKFEATSNLVVVNVSVRDRSGQPVEDLRKEDFVLYEDDKPQKISIFELQRLSSESLPPIIHTSLDKLPPEKPAAEEAEKPGQPSPQPGAIRYKDRRLLVLFFDFSSMKPAEEIRAQQAALKFLDDQMTASDMVAVMTFSSSLELVEDFTDDREKLAQAIRDLPVGDMAELAEDAAAADEEEDASDESNILFMADDTEFNIFNTDRRLSALESATRHLATLAEKKALVYFSSGVGKTGVENQSQLRATINSALKSNVVFYPVDARGLVAEAPMGDASQGAVKGTALYSGKMQRDRQQKRNDAQETLYSLAADTGGKALFDDNDLTLGIVQAQQDTASYYILGYYSTNAAEDGRFRRLKVKVPARPRVRLEHRAGYYAARLFKDFTAADKERQLEEALQLGNPRTELPLALEVNWFRLARDRYFAPVAVKIPGSQIELAHKGASETTELDFIGQVRDSKGKLAGAVRDTIRVKLSGADAGEWSRRHLEYDTGFTLAPGAYRLRFLARENRTGKMGTFETRFTVPDLSAQDNGLRMSSVVWSNQREPLNAAIGGAGASKKLLALHPLIRDSQKLVPNITHVFRRSQTLYVYFEVYDPGVDEHEAAPSVAASLSLYRGRSQIFESQPVRLTSFSAARGRTVAFQFQAPLKPLAAGQYTCQLNVVDETGRKFAFVRAPLVLLP